MGPAISILDDLNHSNREDTITERGGMASSSFPSNFPCAACKFLRRKCLPGCIFAPYFPPEEPHKFASVHKIFGASNVAKLLNDLLPRQREDAVSSLAYEAEARIKDPVYGCVGAISVLQRQVQQLKKELEDVNAELLRYACGGTAIPTPAVPMFSRRTLYQAPTLPVSYNSGDQSDQQRDGEQSM